MVLAYISSNLVNNSGVILTQEGSRRYTKDDRIGVRFLNRRFRMTKCCGHLRTDSSLIVQNWIFMRGIQSAAKNLFFIFFKDYCSSRNRKMRELFFIDLTPLKWIFRKIFHPR